MVEIWGSQQATGISERVLTGKRRLYCHFNRGAPIKRSTAAASAEVGHNLVNSRRA